MDRIAYLDFVAVPVYLVILYALHVRKMVNGPSNRVFRLVVITSLVSAIADLISGVTASNAPLSDLRIHLVEVSNCVYHLFHGLMPALYACRQPVYRVCIYR